MQQTEETLSVEDKDLLYGIVLIDTIYLIAFAESRPTLRQIQLIKKIRAEEPILQNSKMINDIISLSLEDKLKNDYFRTSKNILENLNTIINDFERCEKVLDYAQLIAMAGDEITPTVQNLLDRISDALYL
ncbi:MULTISPECIES: hypothetical protein [Pantoea]|uniref:Uncharacterized protein n=1 Tax=Candidatus Pantoea floridensis TaxID=1938870 RepID=A0A286BZY4_9GAMM|nr:MULTISPECIES: hypothetical protein [Pantoea]PIF22207.1 hypothetical protein BX596_1616 [Enterobacteriaceae bacterium JKS000233]PXW18509.1 hypothetical protein BY447_0062 [Pantoea sp. JKS000250]SOD39714.1 hypothetical protein SAMN06273570_4168 [Pantoea floridensis]